MIKRMVFNSRKWEEAGGDQPDRNKQFFEECTILRTYLAEDTNGCEVLASVQWPDGRITDGHIVSLMCTSEELKERYAN